MQSRRRVFHFRGGVHRRFEQVSPERRSEVDQRRTELRPTGEAERSLCLGRVKELRHRAQQRELAQRLSVTLCRPAHHAVTEPFRPRDDLVEIAAWELAGVGERVGP